VVPVATPEQVASVAAAVSVTSGTTVTVTPTAMPAARVATPGPSASAVLARLSVTRASTVRARTVVPAAAAVEELPA